MDELRLPLFRNKKDPLFLLLILGIILSVNLYLKYQNYKKLKIDKYYKTTAFVLKEFLKTSKNKKPYTILKLKDKNGEIFFGIVWGKHLKDMENCVVNLKVRTDKIGFIDYLKGFFSSVYAVKIVSRAKNFRQEVSNFIKKQHENSYLKELFSALFLGTYLHKNTRNAVQTFGISHLVAISGFHLGVLASMVFFIFSFFYRVFQDRYFPYRSKKLDLTFVSVAILFAYLWLVGFAPSLLRAYIMLVLGYVMYIRHIKIISFETIVLTIVLIVSFYPEMLFSVSFWFSVSGVFYIFLFLHYFKELKPWQIFLSINFWVYFMMMPIVHFVFFSFDIYQLFSPFLSMIFVLFYPIELFLHLINEGGLLDSLVVRLFDVKTVAVSVKTPLWFLVAFVLVSLSAVYKKVFLYILTILDISFFLYLLYRYAFG
ncbi:MAG: ComEC/Rec2 family competence protein [Epsilonproteobacteria bacterium]|nr:ComEC/Rec2 family competence protein [Campylobacterota bacterium]